MGHHVSLCLVCDWQFCSHWATISGCDWLVIGIQYPLGYHCQLVTGLWLAFSTQWVTMSACDWLVIGIQYPMGYHVSLCPEGCSFSLPLLRLAFSTQCLQSQGAKEMAPSEIRQSLRAPTDILLGGGGTHLGHHVSLCLVCGWHLVPSGLPCQLVIGL